MVCLYMNVVCGVWCAYVVCMVYVVCMCIYVVHVVCMCVVYMVCGVLCE